jgi:hypothetical protein
VKLSIGIAQKLKQMLDGEEIQSSKLKQTIVLKMVEDGAIQYRNTSKSKRTYFINNSENLINYLITEFGINNLNEYVTQLNNPNLTRGDAIKIASDSKIKKIRSFKGFLVNSIQPINATINNNATVISPVEGTFTFIYDFNTFTIPDDVTIVGIENPESFRYINKQTGLFKDIKPLFVSRYPQNQNNDFIEWMNDIPNNYLHFGDFDFSGINIFLNEYQKHIGKKATFFIPDEIEIMIKENGNTNNYDVQIYREPDSAKINDEKLLNLIKIIHKYKKGLEQEYLINVVSPQTYL